MASSTHLTQFQIALRDEINIIRKRGGQRTHIFNGRYLGQRQQFHIYTFSVENELHIPDDARIDLEYHKQRYEGQVVSAIGFDLILALHVQIGYSIPSATLYTEPWYLLEELQKRLVAADSLPGVNRQLIQKLLWDNSLAHSPNLKQAKRLLDEVAAGLGQPLHYNDDQFQAIGHVYANDVSFVWGPPGTGKTRTLGMTVAALVAAGESVLILAHSNIAVDVATLSMARHLSYSPLYQKGRLLRYGVIYSSELKDEAFQSLHVKGVLRQQKAPLIQHIDELEAQREKLTRQLGRPSSEAAKRRLQDELEAVKLALEPLREQLKQHEDELLERAVVVACTFSKAVIAPQIYQRRFDNVIIDEASMAYIPHCVFASSLARKRIAIFGDFRQLAPISQAETEAAQRWLQRDIFDEAGIIAKVNTMQPDPRLTLLSTQYRMHPEIAAIPNKLFYQGRLHNGPVVATQSESVVASEPNPGAALAFYDLSQVQAPCFQERDSYSRFNVISALMAAELAYQAVQSGPYRVGIITPYNAQTRLINQLLHDLQLPREQVTAATVHRFQGSECDIIIFDAVEGPPRKPGLVVNGSSDQSLRLANVAVSRARGKFIALANRDYITTRLSSDNQFRHLLDTIASRIPVKQVRYSLKQTNGLLSEDLPGLTFFPNGRKASDLLNTAVRQAHDLIAIIWPDTPVRSYHFSIQSLHSSPTEHRRYYISGAGLEQFEPHEMPNRMFWKANRDQKWGLVSLDNHDLWVFPQPDAPQGPVLHLHSPKAVTLLNTFLRLVPDEESQYETVEKRLKKGQSPYGASTCPRCNNPLIPGMGDYGPRMICASGCGYAKRITPEEATSYARFMQINCPECGSQMKGIKGYNGVYLKCTNQKCGRNRDLSTLI